jgi:DNA-binding CsgD family transcriptional regulator
MEPFDTETITGALAKAAIDQERWLEATEVVAKCTRSFGALLLPVVGHLPLIAVTPSLEKSFHVYAGEGWMERDDRYRGKQTFLRRGVITDHDCLPAEQRRRSPFYQDFLARCKLPEFAGVRVGRGDHVWNLSIQRTPAQGAFSRQELSWLAGLSGRLDSVAEISRAFGLAKGEAVLDAFQFSERAAMLLNRAGEVVRANVAAEAMIGPDLMVSRKRIQSASRDATEQLQRALRTLLWTPVASLVPPIAFPRAGGGNLVLYLMRLNGGTASPLSAYHAIVVIVDPGAGRSVLATTLRILFDLTPAEARLATAIANGQDLTAFATTARVAKETVRKQLRAVFQKTETSRQSELGALLNSLVPHK